jgi:mannose-1-phosphate guanylyltransferase
MRHAVIMAGGQGKRLWPHSRKDQPKQLLRLAGGKSLMELAVDRLDGLFEPEHIYVVTNAEYAEKVADMLPDLPTENIVGEPQGRDTANAICLAAELLAGKDPEGTMAVFTADHIIRPQDCFAGAVRLAMDTAEAKPDSLLTFGIRPTWPNTGLGYVEVGGKVRDDVWDVESFEEKPDHATARKYVESGKYYWNSGMFVWTLPAIRKALEEFLPTSKKKLAPVADAVASGEDYTGILRSAYPTLEKISIDFAIMEKARQVHMVVLQCEWIDLGSWPALEDVLELDDKGNAILADHHMVIDSYRNVLVSQGEHLLAVMGMDDCIVVHSDDATLVCKKSDNQRLKELVDAIGKHFGEKFL